MNLDWIFWVIGFLVISGAMFGVVALFIASYLIYVSVLSRNEEGKWGRAPSCDEPDYLEMYNLGMEWHKEYVKHMAPAHIVNEGLNLYGEYYNFGREKCVIILPGRSESLHYSYFFAQPYKAAGYNVLVIDPRSHGKSDGIYNSIGFGESRDVLAWAKFLHETYGMQHIVLHGLCVGATAGMFAITSDNCPDYIEGIVVEGMFANFNAILKQHLIARKKPRFLILSFMDMWCKKYTNSTTRYGAMDAVTKLKKPILFLHSREDNFSLPELTEQMYNKCASDKKELVWFETGGHSKLRITHMETYDAAIRGFLTTNFQIQQVS